MNAIIFLIGALLGVGFGLSQKGFVMRLHPGLDVMPRRALMLSAAARLLAAAVFLSFAVRISIPALIAGFSGLLVSRWVLVIYYTTRRLDRRKPTYPAREA
ncbi:MAG: hypothetical protein P1P76_01935 [Anaerolineales bacterium]|nr:hypothetical protein [Anaerolineales bacterium]